MTNHEKNLCPRCNTLFECKCGSITLCHCSQVNLSQAQREYLSERWDTCLCHACLLEIARMAPGAAGCD
ncbi:MAG: hypothetical protein CSA52_00550 [Gammaproteobacteria bacterium]|nr:MAG: hypothetical protein CSB48_06520 [Pseudomonadota bacterium]PIE38893.1 MAG: hypothetical protein CSA52_00550 [Gammaproteobacteria bacterium]